MLPRFSAIADGRRGRGARGEGANEGARVKQACVSAARRRMCEETIRVGTIGLVQRADFLFARSKF
jgi:hypothetical protein